MAGCLHAPTAITSPGSPASFAEGRRPRAAAKPRQPSLRPYAVGKASTLARTAVPAKAEEEGAMAWLPWRWAAAAEAQQDQAAGRSSGGGGLLGPLLWGGASSAPQQPNSPPPQQQPVTSKTGTQLVLLWPRGEEAADAKGRPQGTGPAAPSFPYWRLPGTGSTAAAKPARPPPAAAPIISCAGGGIFFFWEMGVMKYLMAHFDLSKCQLIGASAGGLAVALAESGVSPDRAVRAAFRISEEARIWDRPGGLVGIWGGLVRHWLDELLPEDAAERCSGRVRLVATEVPSLRLQYIDTFQSREELIDALMASAHLPFLLDGKATATFRGQQWIDGSLYDFIWGNNSELLICDGDAFVVDYFNDDQLQYSRLDFVKLSSVEGVLDMERAGYAYAERLDAQGQLELFLGAVRKGPVRRLIEYPVRQVARVFA